MDSNLTIKPRPGAAPRSNALRDPIAVREAAETELDPSKAVIAAADGGSKHGHGGSHHEPFLRESAIDPDARAALFSAMDVRDEHVEQTPNQVLMRQRAYQQHPAPKAKPESPAEDLPDPHADIEA